MRTPFSFSFLVVVSSLFVLSVGSAGAQPAGAEPATASPADAAAASGAAPGLESSTGKPAVAAEDVTPDDAAAGAETKRPRSRRTVQVGQSPQETLVSGVVIQSDEDSDEWTFRFHGFFRAPMHLGIGKLANPGPGQSSRQFHAPPIVPDGNYTTWQYTNVTPGPWTEMLFQYGNSTVMMTAAIATYNITSGSFRNMQGQLGIDRAFVTINWPEIHERLKLTLNAGIFGNRYGASGRYDAGAYETHIIGRTRIAGETLTGQFQLTDSVSVIAEHGIGAKTDVQKFFSATDELNARQFLPYPGPEQQGTTLLHHAHLGVDFAGLVTATAHYMLAFTQDSLRTGTTPDGSMRTFGFDLRLAAGWWGNGYLGASTTKAVHASVVSDVQELLHSQGGWQFTNNYLAGTDGTGTVNAVGFQYDFSMAALLVRPQNWWGDGADLTISAFGLYTWVSDVPAAVLIRKKMKWGTQILYTPLPFISFGGRFDLVQPDLQDGQQSFAVLTPRIVLRTRFVTHEQIVIQYAHYSNKSQTRLPYPYDQYGPYKTTEKDSGVFSIMASMWW